MQPVPTARRGRHRTPSPLARLKAWWDRVTEELAESVGVLPGDVEADQS